jgi:saccharopine dehydrogenase-like NADP-dependent oxidoreductase
MKIIVLGGAGDVGSRAVEELALAEGVQEVAIADRNTAAAQRIATRLAGARARVTVHAVDADDHAGLVRVITGYDVAASALGPFFRFEAKLARAAIEAGADYASVCDEWEAAEAVLDGLQYEARRRGRIVLTGLGTSPGVTNIGIRYLADQLDRPRRADVQVYQPLDAGGGEAVVRHMLHIISGDTVIWRRGARTTIPACSESARVDFPRFGVVQVWNMGHAEPVTVPRFIPQIEEVNFRMGFGTGSGVFITPAKLGLWKLRSVADAFVRLVVRWEQRQATAIPADGAIRVDVWGEKDGEERHLILCGTGQMREVTGLSLAVGTLMLGRKQLSVHEGGVYPPEGCIDAGTFIRIMRDKGLVAHEDIAQSRPLIPQSASR